MPALLLAGCDLAVDDGGEDDFQFQDVEIEAAIETGGFLTETLTESDSRLSDIDSDFDDTYVDPYELRVDDPGTVELDMTSSDINTYLYLFDRGGDRIAFDNDGGTGLDSEIVEQLSTGDYIIAATSFEVETGEYSLDVERLDDFRGNEVEAELTQGESRIGKLESSDTELGDVDPELDDGSHVDLYEIDIDDAETVEIDMRSEEIDTYLYLYDRDGEFITSDDDGGAGFDSEIINQLSPGEYIIVASSFSEDEFGEYTLEVN